MSVIFDISTRFYLIDVLLASSGWYRYALLAFITIGLALIFLRLSRKETVISPLFFAVILLSTSGLALPQLAFLIMAIEFLRKYGHWPQVMTNDPKHHVGKISSIYDYVMHHSDFIIALSGIILLISCGLILTNFATMTRRQKMSLIVLILLNVLLLVIDPGNLYQWFHD